MHQVVRVVARVRALPACAERVAAVLDALVAPSRGEVGCVQYELLRSANDPAEFVFVEAWESDVALDAHLGSAHVAGAVAALDGLLVESPDIRRYRPLA